MSHIPRFARFLNRMFSFSLTAGQWVCSASHCCITSKRLYWYSTHICLCMLLRAMTIHRVRVCVFVWVRPASNRVGQCFLCLRFGWRYRRLSIYSCALYIHSEFNERMSRKECAMWVMLSLSIGSQLSQFDIYEAVWFKHLQRHTYKRHQCHWNELLIRGACVCMG